MSERVVGYIAVIRRLWLGWVLISLFVRFRRSRGDGRQQIKWFASAAALTLVWTFLRSLSPLLARGHLAGVCFSSQHDTSHRYGHRHPALPPL